LSFSTNRYIRNKRNDFNKFNFEEDYHL
jgi:hypothetical protein